MYLLLSTIVIVSSYVITSPDGRVYGRGAQDMKCVCVQYIEAIRKLHSVNPTFRPQRTIHLTFGECLVSPLFAFALSNCMSFTFTLHTIHKQ
jgi:hypothetical protein